MDEPVALKDEAQGEETPKREWVKNPDGIPEIYSNFIHSSWSLFDTRMLFGQLKPSLGNSKEFVIEEKAAISLSWAQTKNLASVLAGMVEAYESVNGKIENPKLAPRYEDVKKTKIATN